MAVRCSSPLSRFAKGMTIPRSIIKKDLPGDLSEREFYQLQYYWIQDLQKQLLDAGMGWTVAVVKDVVRILSDTEAAAHNDKRFKQYLGRLKARNVLGKAVDATKLSEHDRRAHEKRILRQGAILTHIELAKREPIKPAANAHPGVSLERLRNAGTQARQNHCAGNDPTHPAQRPTR